MENDPRVAVVGGVVVGPHVAGQAGALVVGQEPVGRLVLLPVPVFLDSDWLTEVPGGWVSY